MAAFCLHEGTDKQVAVLDMMAVVCVGGDVCEMFVNQEVLNVMNDNDDGNDTNKFTQAYC